VAASTVSRYLNGQLRVTPATEARLLDAVETLGYVPNAQAKNLARRRSGVIGFVVPGMSNPYFGAIADHVVEAVERRGLMVLLCSTHSQAVKESSYLDLLASGAIDGMLYLGSFRSNQRLAQTGVELLFDRFPAATPPGPIESQHPPPGQALRQSSERRVVL
jgi:LacI family transcriptional regulator